MLVASGSMSADGRPVSPLGESRFEREGHIPLMLQPTSPMSTASSTHAWRNDMHFSKPSISAWSASDPEEHTGYSTEATSPHYSPVDGFSPKVSREIVQPTHTHPSDEEKGASINVVDSEEWYAQFDPADGSANDNTGDECPDRATLAAVDDIPVYSADGQAIPFGSLYHQSTAVNQRQLIVFIRHFYCGACQAYVKALTEAISLREYYSTPIPTSIIVIGCGQPDLIPFYKSVTGCPFAIFAEPTRLLYKKLRMTFPVGFGRQRPEYMKRLSTTGMITQQLGIIREGLRTKAKEPRISELQQTSNLTLPHSLHDDAQQEHDATQTKKYSGRRLTKRRSSSSQQSSNMAIRARDLIRGGNIFQIGGEFLFEDGEVVWCHRMRNHRDHVETSEIKHLLGLTE